MRNRVIFLVLLLTTSLMSSGQKSDPLVSNCLTNAGAHLIYLKDFRIQLGKADDPGDLRVKAQMSLWKNTKYRFTLCSARESGGQMIFNLRDESNAVVASSFDKKTGKTHQYIDFVCGKSGVYHLSYDFEGGEKGSGVGIVSMIR